MKKDELKKILKPLIKECIKEVMFEQGTLSTVISEVVKGLGNPIISESRSASPAPKTTQRVETAKEAKQRRQRMLEAIGRDSFNGVDLFEGTTPAPAPSKESGHGPMAGTDPRDPGVDISSFLGASANWKTLAGK